MNLTLPVPSSRSGPLYAQDINDALTLIDAHDHSDGYGVRVTPDGLDIDQDLSMQSHNLTSARSLRLDNQLTTLAGVNDLRSLYVVSGNLYYNNSSGTAVKITDASSLNGGAASSGVWPQVNTTSNLTISSSDTFVAIICKQATPINIQLPAANAVSPGRFYVIIDGNLSSVAYPIAVLRAGSDTINTVAANKSLESTGAAWIFRSDGVSNWNMLSFGHHNLTTQYVGFGSTDVTEMGLTKGPNASSATAAIRVANNTTIVSARNAANSGNIAVVTSDSSNNISFGDGTTNAQALVQANNNVSLYSTSGAIYLGSTTQLADSKHISYVTPRTVVTQIGIGNFYWGDTDWSVSNYVSTLMPGGVASAATSVMGYIDLNLPNGCTITGLEMCYTLVGSARSPVTRLQFEIVRAPYTADAATSPTSLYSGGFQQVPAYASFGTILTHSAAPNQNQVVDNSNYVYRIRVREETTGTALNVVRGFKITYTVPRVTV